MKCLDCGFNISDQQAGEHKEMGHEVIGGFFGETHEEVMEQVKYCGDCLYHRLKRGKNRQITGEHICVKWDLLKSEQTQVGNCSHFIDRNGPEILIKDPDQSLPENVYEPPLDITGERLRDVVDATFQLMLKEHWVKTHSDKEDA